MSCTNCLICGWPSRGEGCGQCRPRVANAPNTDSVERRIAEIGRAAKKIMGDVPELLPLPYVALQEKVSAALQEYLAAIGAPGETALEVHALHAGDEYFISHFAVETRLDEPITQIKRLEGLATQGNLRGAEEVYLLNRKMDEIKKRLVDDHGWTKDDVCRLLRGES